MAHKKAAGSAKNLRDSKPKYRGVKIFWWQNAKAWNIIIRQKWNKYEAWKNTYIAKDFSIHAEIDGVVTFSKSHKQRFDGRKYLKTIVNVLPLEVEKPVVKVTKKTEVEKKPAAKTTTKKAVATKKPAAKKTTAKKTTTKKAVATKKPAAKKTVAKKSTSKKVVK